MPDNPENQDAKKRLFAGKYETPEALESGYNNLFTEGQKNLAKMRALEEQNNILRTIAESRGQDPRDDDEETPQGGMSEEATKALVASQFQELMGPLLTGAEKVALLGPDQGPINSFLMANPEVQATFQGISDAKAAAEYARAMYRLNQNAEGDRRVENNSESTRSAVEASRSAAEVPGSRSISRTPTNPEQEHAEDLKAALERADKTGDATEYVQKRLFGGPKSVVTMWGPGEPIPESMLPKGNN